MKYSVLAFMGLAVAHLVGCTQNSSDRLALGLLECKQTFDTSFIAMAKTFESIPVEKRLSLVVGAIRERDTCEEKAVKSATSR